MAKHSHKITDPVCGNEIKPKNVGARSEHDGRTYYFCSTMCKEQFDREPARYVRKEVA